MIAYLIYYCITGRVMSPGSAFLAGLIEGLILGALAIGVLK